MDDSLIVSKGYGEKVKTYWWELNPAANPEARVMPVRPSVTTSALEGAGFVWVGPVEFLELVGDGLQVPQRLPSVVLWPVASPSHKVV